MDNIKVLYVTGLGPLSGGGGNKRVYEILKRVRKFKINYIPVVEKKNYASAISSFPDLKEILKELNCYAINLRPSNKFSFTFYLNLFKVSSDIAKIVNNEKVDIIISAHESFDLINIVRAASHFTSTPWSAILQLTPILGTVIGTVNGPLDAIRKSAAKGGLIKTIARYFKLLLLTRSLRETLPLSVSFSIPYELSFFDQNLNIKVLDPPVGVDETIYNVKASNIDFDAIFFARLHPLKGLFDVPFIWKEVIKEKPKAKLLIAGSWQNKQYICEFRELCRKLGVINNIIYAGFLPKDVLYSYVKSVKTIVYPSYLDAFPLTVLESLACGVPVVCYNINPIRFSFKTRAVIKVNVGNKVEFAKNVLTILEDSEYQKKLSLEALSFSSRYNWDFAAKEEFNSISHILEHWSV